MVHLFMKSHRLVRIYPSFDHNKRNNNGSFGKMRKKKLLRFSSIEVFVENVSYCWMDVRFHDMKGKSCGFSLKLG